MKLAIGVLAGLLGLASGWALAQSTIVVSSTDVPKAIPDNNPALVCSNLNVGAALRVTDVNVIIDNLTHTSVADLHIELQSPSSPSNPVILAFSENGILSGLGTPDNFIGTIFDDQAPVNLRAGTAPYTGRFNVNYGTIQNPLLAFNGQSSLGTWKLCVSDRAAADTGTLNAWSLEITGVDLTRGVPTLSNLGLMILIGLMFAAVAASRLRRQIHRR
jgi:subtilisin-like proprotein convertase family protein